MGVELACWCGKGGNWVVVGYSRPKWNNYGWKGSCKMGADPSEGRKTEGLDAQMEASTSCCISVTESIVPLKCVYLQFSVVHFILRNER